MSDDLAAELEADDPSLAGDAAGAVLKMVDDWQQKAARLCGEAAQDPGTLGAKLKRVRAGVYTECAAAAWEAIEGTGRT